MSISSMFYRAGQDALIERTRARTDLEKLAVDEKRLDNLRKLVLLVREVESIQDPEIRRRVIEALSRGDELGPPKLTGETR